MTDEFSVIITTTDSEDEATSLAQRLVAEKLAACVQILPVTSHYVWEEKVEESKELVLLIKTRASLFSQVEQFLAEQHSYDVPEIIQLPITAGSASYLGWITTNTE